MRTGLDGDLGSAVGHGWRAGLGRAALPLRRLLSHAGKLLLPGQCALCGSLAGGRVVCAACHQHYIEGWQLARLPRCGKCANPLPAGAGAGLCGYCLRTPPAFDTTVAAAAYALPLDRLVLQLKFGGRLALARLFGEALADACNVAGDLVRPDVLCPVPLGPRRLAQRGYNQALEMARPLARRIQVPLQVRMAIRVKETEALSRSATPAERRAHIAGAFAALRRDCIEGRHIGLVDDVMTSGATMNELAALLKRYGAARVTCLVFARTPPHDE
ncbi:ComF family protein [Duganella sp. FT92W]|uniref:ComF family protein n=1 Tax=Pseudoduganella rivuli TaxID=2666085 RepID=A0A7X2IP26_9BURK|nr:ComF family protein [Pseudoduganella rivuli]MRV73132.1 ComF family protein [Pseudoduganella rivuli]